MAPLRLGLWVVRRWISHPGGAGFAVALILAWPLFVHLQPPGAGVAAHGRAAGLEQWLYLAGMIGTGLALGVLGNARSFLAWLPARPRWGGEALGLLLSVAAAQGLALGGAWLAPGEAGWDRLHGMALGFADLHLVALAWATLRLQLPINSLLAVFLLGAWFGPALLLEADSSTEVALRGLFDASQHLSRAASDPGAWPVILSSAALTAGLWLACALFAVSPSRSG